MIARPRAGMGRISIGLATGLAMAVFVATPGVQAVQDEAARARAEITAQLEELGTTLRAAVFSGTLTGEEARDIYGRVTRAAKLAYVEEFGDDEKTRGDAPSAKGNVVRLFAPKPERIQALYRAELRRRDLPWLAGALDLDPDQVTIAKFLVEDYLEAHHLAATPLREAIAQYRSTTRGAYIAHVLDEADVQLGAAVESARRVDRTEAVARTREALGRIEREKADGLAAASDVDRARFETWRRRVIEATGDLDARLAAIRDRATAQLADLSRAGATITAEDLVGLAKQLRADRRQLRADLLDALEAMATEEQRGEANARFDRGIARVRIGHLLPHGRLGGESMDLDAALAETRQRQASAGAANDALAHADALLRARAPALAAALDERTEAAIDREIAGLAFLAVRDRIAAASGESIFEVEDRRLASAVRPYAVAARREITASVAARDALLALLAETVASIEEVDPGTHPGTHPGLGLATTYRAAALRRGFPVEMGRRWAERAIAAALDLEALDEGVRETLRRIEADVATELATLREAAIAQRIERDPKLAHDFIDAELEDVGVEFDDDVWREPRHAAFTAVDDRVEGRLRGILMTEQLERLPARWIEKEAFEKDAQEKKAGRNARRDGKR